MISSLAVYGLVYDNQTLLQLAYDQQRLYRSTLLQSNGLVAHIYDVSNRSWTDGTSWATGVGWAAAGFLRTLACIAQSSHSDEMLQQKADLYSWTGSILDAAYGYADPNNGLVRNHMNDTSSFQDAAGSMLIAYATFRYASMAADADQHVEAAEKIYQTVQGRLDQFGHFVGLQTVDALSFRSPGPTSPESLAFALMLAAARRDYAQRNVTSLYGPSVTNRAAPVVQNGVVQPGPDVRSSSSSSNGAGPTLAVSMGITLVLSGLLVAAAAITTF